jgi:hypothetical protein
MPYPHRDTYMTFFSSTGGLYYVIGWVLVSWRWVSVCAFVRLEDWMGGWVVWRDVVVELAGWLAGWLVGGHVCVCVCVCRDRYLDRSKDCLPFTRVWRDLYSIYSADVNLVVKTHSIPPFSNSPRYPRSQAEIKMKIKIGIRYPNLPAQNYS